MRARRIEFGAGVAAAALGLLAFIFVLTAPIVPVSCPANASCARAYETFVEANGAGGLFFALAMLVAALVGGVSAVVEARKGRTVAAIPLWVAAALAFGGCALAASGPGVLYLPSVLALGLAAYASLLARLQSRPRQPAA